MSKRKLYNSSNPDKQKSVRISDDDDEIRYYDDSVDEEAEKRLHSDVVASSYDLVLNGYKKELNTDDKSFIRSKIKEGLLLDGKDEEVDTLYQRAELPGSIENFRKYIIDKRAKKTEQTER